MADLPSATTRVNSEAGAQAVPTGFLVVMGCCERNADGVPRVFSSVKALLAQHGYAQGASYVASHIQETKKSIIFVGLPSATAGAVGRLASVVAGSSAITIAAGSAGFLEEAECELEVINGGTIGTNGITFDFTADNWRSKKRIRLGTATSYTVPYLGIVINFGAGTLIAGDTYAFVTTAPMWDTTGIAAARAALATQQKAARSWLVVGDLPNSTFAGYVTTQANAYETSNERFVYARAQVRDRLPQAEKSKVLKRMTGTPPLTFLEVGGTGDTITRSVGSFITDGFAVGDVITVAGSVSNNVTGPIASLTALVITLGTTDLANEGPVSNCTLVGSAGLTFAEVGGTGDTITRTEGSWLSDGFRVGDTITITGTALNNVSGVIAALTATVLTFDTTDLAAEVIGSYNVTATAGETEAAFIATLDAAFASVDAQKRIDLGIGRGRKACPITGWLFRRPVQWAASIREYQHDIHVTTWAKKLGPLDGWSLEDENGTVVELDDRGDAGDAGALAARFTCFRTWANGPNGAFIARSLTRATEGDKLSQTHNLAVANLCCTIVQKQTELFIGETPPVNDDGTIAEEFARNFETIVDAELEASLLRDLFQEGQRASFAKWTASRDDDLTAEDATMNGSAELHINGTIVHVNTAVRVS